MAMRLHELHPSLVHYPIALLPLAVGADALALWLKRPSLDRAGRTLLAMTSGAMAVSAAAGLVAQRAVKAEGPAQDMLKTHRRLNVGLFAGTVALTAVRQRSAPGAGSILAGLAGMALMTYTAYLGGRMVYAHGVGVERAGGLDRSRSPQLKPGRWGEAASVAGQAAVEAFGPGANENGSPALGTPQPNTSPA